jgi:hypothetical protein
MSNGRTRKKIPTRTFTQRNPRLDPGHARGARTSPKSMISVPKSWFCDLVCCLFDILIAQHPVNRFQSFWTLYPAKIMPQIDSAHSKTLNMHPRAVAGPSVFFCAESPSPKRNKKWVEISTAVQVTSVQCLAVTNRDRCQYQITW